MGRLEPREKMGPFFSHSCSVMELPGQAPLPIAVCLFKWQCPYLQSELQWRPPGSFQETKHSLQGHPLPHLKRRSLGTEDSEGVIITRMHWLCQGPLREATPVWEAPSTLLLISPVIGQQALLTIPAPPASQASTQDLWTTCQPSPIPLCHHTPWKAH